MSVTLLDEPLSYTPTGGRGYQGKVVGIGCIVASFRAGSHGSWMFNRHRRRMQSCCNAYTANAYTDVSVYTYSRIQVGAGVSVYAENDPESTTGLPKTSFTFCGRDLWKVLHCYYIVKYWLQCKTKCGTSFIVFYVPCVDTSLNI